MRRDIQFLRGLAVSVVVLYHAGVTGIPNGFLGVDVFFVISGFLITSIILRDLDAGTFSFNGFYLRRAKRLLPAIYCTLIFTTVLSQFFLTMSQWNDYVSQLLGAITFTANMVLPLQTGYFAGAAEGKPLLHIWSLSLEEQYYLCLPLLLFLCSRRFRAPVIALLLIVSLAICAFSVTYPFGRWGTAATNSANWAFYLFPTRAWELLAGSFAAWAMIRSPSLAIAGWAKWTALLTMVVILCVPTDTVHPRLDSILVVVATMLLVLGKDDWLPSFRVVAAIERLGDWSYSLYLVHWPLLAFAHNAFLGEVPFWLRLSLIPVAVSAAYLQYRFVEERFRRGWQRAPRQSWSWLVTATVGILLLIVPRGWDKGPAQDFAEIRRVNHGLSTACQVFGANLVPDARCVTGSHPVLAVWGDSFAMHLVPGLRENREIPGDMVQLTRSSCAPILTLARYGKAYDRHWAENCLEFNRRVFDYIRKTESIRVVLLSASFGPYVNGGGHVFSSDHVADISKDVFVQRMVGTIGAIIDAGKRPVLVSAPPSGGFNIGECLERQESGAVNLARKSCDLSLAEYKKYYEVILEALREVQRKTGITIIWLNRLLCDDRFCRTKLDGVYLYRDAVHLSRTGSKYLIGSLKMARYF